jgi:hypothetical protein
MSNLWTFGDSYTDSFTPSDTWRMDYVKWKGYIPKVYGEIIANKLDYKLQNISEVASCNYTIFQNICNNIDKINPDDVVIIGWSVVHRFRFVHKDRWVRLFPESIGHTPIELSDDTIQTILINRMHKLYAEEVNSWIKIINYSLPNNKILHWSWWDNKDLNAKIFDGFETITKETNGKVVDGHWSEQGQLDASNYILKELNIDNKLI